VKGAAQAMRSSARHNERWHDRTGRNKLFMSTVLQRLVDTALNRIVYLLISYLLCDVATTEICLRSA
jgi:hypothetical protein